MNITDQQMLIDGNLVGAGNGQTYEVVNPATEEVVGTAPDAQVEDVERAIAAARRAFDETDWSTDVELRRRCLTQLQNNLRKVADEIRPVLTAESGMPLALSFPMGLDGPVESLGYWPELLSTYEFERSLPRKHIMGGQSLRTVRKEAAGVVAAITPWNFPFQLNLTKIGGALAAGCTVILKPAPDTPWSGTVLAAAAADTDIPAGVLNIVTTSDNRVAEVLTTHRDVDQITFTGSTATGRLVMRNASETIKRVSLELGGKSAAIILDDADLASSVAMAAGAVCMHAGQGCALATRLLIPNHLMDQAAAIGKQILSGLPWGDPTDMANMMGPLINRSQFEKVLDYIELGKTQARLVIGGTRPEQHSKGYFVPPTLFSHVPADSRIAREEIFGPVICLIGFADDDDAVRIANDSEFGLSGSVYSSDVERAKRVAVRLRTGTIALNGAQWFDPESPFGGYKQSGLGREWGVEGLEDFLETKTFSYPAT
ncbi:aldehyde dehydrogenase family protein [Rhodococcus qingshengii]|uniref:aldehyde dehydrogenase family protein n=1 Tax=Rhodococcus qingshengii TaxID=334542 RepID=UPI0024B9D97A|nr:aldehyde dehydrogenase family protein [Rhodococcus qingshengii]MDJ0489978.1 aldehyde dehydrogenase family protein [Rhodococcus qingshengii]